jgi:hypothetical protein
MASRNLDQTISGTTTPESVKALEQKIQQIEKDIATSGDGTLQDSPGTVPEIFTLQITAAATVAGASDLTVDGVVYNPVLTVSDINTNALEISDFVNSSIPYYTAVVATDTVTITSTKGGDETDATYAAGAATSSAGTVIVTQQGVDGTPLNIEVSGATPFKLFVWNLLKMNNKYTATFVEELPN